MPVGTPKLVAVQAEAWFTWRPCLWLVSKPLLTHEVCNNSGSYGRKWLELLETQVVLENLHLVAVRKKPTLPPVGQSWSLVFFSAGQLWGQ